MKCVVSLAQMRIGLHDKGPFKCYVTQMGVGGVKFSQKCWLPSKPKITLANLAKVEKYMLAKYIFV